METIKGHMLQSSQGLQSTKNNITPPLILKEEILKDTPKEEDMEDPPPPIRTNDMHIWKKPISKLYTDDCGRFPILSRSGN